MLRHFDKFPFLSAVPTFKGENPVISLKTININLLDLFLHEMWEGVLLMHATIIAFFVFHRVYLKCRDAPQSRKRPLKLKL